MFGVWRKVQAMNLDIIIGAALNCVFFAIALRSKTTWFTIATLVLVVWIIYTGDRLLDTRKEGKYPNTYRHRFHKKYRPYLLTSLIVMALMALLILPLLPLVTVVWGAGLFLMVICYFIFIVLAKQNAFIKEPVIALLYTCGVALPAVSQVGIDGRTVFLLIQHAMLAFLNLALISYYEADEDLKSGHPSLVNIVGVKGAVRSVNFVFYGLLLSLAFFLFIYPGMFSVYIQATFLSMWTILFMIKTFREYFSKFNRYRTWADLAFWAPGWLLWL